MDDKNFNHIMDRVLNIPLPEGLAERLEHQIDDLAQKEKKQKSNHLIYWVVSMAAAIILLCIGIFLGTDNITSNQHKLADTYTDPAEAAIVAEQSLVFVSHLLNKGLDQVNNAGNEIEKVNQIVNKHLIKD